MRNDDAGWGDREREREREWGPAYDPLTDSYLPKKRYNMRLVILGTGDWGLETGGWGLAQADWCR